MSLTIQTQEKSCFCPQASLTSPSPQQASEAPCFPGPGQATAVPVTHMGGLGLASSSSRAIFRGLVIGGIWCPGSGVWGRGSQTGRCYLRGSLMSWEMERRPPTQERTRLGTSDPAPQGPVATLGISAKPRSQFPHQATGSGALGVLPAGP